MGFHRLQDGTASHPVVTSASALSRGILRRSKGKESKHFNADASEIELLFRIIHPANQLSIYGADTSWCEEFGLTSYEKEDTSDKSATKENEQKLARRMSDERHRNSLLTIGWETFCRFLDYLTTVDITHYATHHQRKRYESTVTMKCNDPNLQSGPIRNREDYWTFEQSPVPQNSDLSCSACAPKLRNVPQSLFPLVSVRMALIDTQHPKARRMWPLSFCLSVWILWAIFQATLRAHRSCVNASSSDLSSHFEHEDCARENQCSESHLEMDPFFPEFSCAVMYHLRTARCASVPRIVGPFVKSTWIPAALYLETLRLIALNSSIKQQNLFHLLSG